MREDKIMDESHPNRASYELIWKEVIAKEIAVYQRLYVNCIELIPNIKEAIWDKYVELNTYCK